MRNLLLAALTISASFVCAQETYPVNGTLEKDLTVYVIDNATLHTSATDTVFGSLVIKEGKLLAVGAADRYPSAVHIDATGCHIYPAFIDLWSEVGMPDQPRQKRELGPQDLSSKKGPFGWNEAIRPEVRAVEHLSREHKIEQAEKLRKAGFGAVLTHVQDGIMRGTGTLIALDQREHFAVLNTDAGSFGSFRKGSSTQDYPSSLMGAIALFRQTFYDANWYAEATNRRETNLSLEALNRTKALPWFFECTDKLDLLRAQKMADEFGLSLICRERGDSYQRMGAIAQAVEALVVDLNFPEPPDVSDPHLARLVPFSDLKHWELAAMNPAAIHHSGIPFAFTTDGLKDPAMALTNIRKAIAMGLPEQAALAALIETPARLIGAEEMLGALKVGMLANFIVTDGSPFAEGAKLYETWVLGKRHVHIDRDIPDLSGTYGLTMESQLNTLHIKGSPGAHSAELIVIRPKGETQDTTVLKVKLQQERERVALRFGPLDSLFNGVYRLSGHCFSDSRILKGDGEDPQGNRVLWAAVRESDHEARGAKKDDLVSPPSSQLVYPFTAYGRGEMPVMETLLIRNATVWTNDAQGIIEGGDVLIHEGKVRAVGRQIDVKAVFGKTMPDVVTYDATGLHLTPGIIDEHSHIAISRGVNEGTQASSAEVSIATVVNSEDVNIYRQLSGGVTAAQLLHGSANPIGGQSAIVKLRWGATPDEMLIQNAAPFIKFALGENVKQSNWGAYYTSRFPQTRMGVEQVYYDHFIRASEYEREWKQWAAQADTRRRRNNQPRPSAPRRDLEMETLVEILNKERFISCHSYRQDEINMLMHVADSMGFVVNTFTHILEGYKVADKMRKHGAGGSSFSDWWAYKFEVKDAIPYNGAVLWSQGVVTAFNSDDAEMARRLNQEAAKAVKYGGVPEEEALKFVTLNPAKLLHLDDRMGSITVGKDADLVLWNEHPLSIYAKAMVTFVDGRRMFDREDDLKLREAMKHERARIIQRMLDAGAAGGSKPTEKLPQHYHCNTLTEEIR
jgi:imidazolonepropionase-like amidohydrolase